MANQSEVYAYGGYLFRYNYDRSLVQVIAYADDEMIAEEAKWKAKHRNGLYGIEKDGTYVIDSVGLSRENWDDEVARDSYLDVMVYELNAELDYLLSEFSEGCLA